MKKQGVSRRHFLAFCSDGITGIWLMATGLVWLPGKLVFAMSGSCSFCGKEAREIFGLTGVTQRNIRVCDECINKCLAIIAEQIGIKPSLPAWAEPDVDPLYEGINDPELLARVVRHLASERRNRLIDALATAILPSNDAVIGPPRSGLQCSFCEKSQAEVMTLVAGPTVFICDGCIGDATVLFMRHGWQPGRLETT